MVRSIVVSSNCQAPGIAAAMRYIFPDCQVKAHVIDGTPSNELTLENILKEADVCFTSRNYDFIQRVQSYSTLFVKIPQVVFNAFHPDISYADDVTTGRLTRFHYNSNIAIWSYNNDLSEVEASKLFNHDVYDALGYFEYWSSATGHLKAIMEDCKLDFRKFYLYAKRRGAFMYSLNHPKQFALTQVALLAAPKANISSKIPDTVIDLDDGLAPVQWPIYPEIGDFYSLSSSYQWKLDQIYVDGLIPYLNFAYSSYEFEGIRRGNLRNRDAALAVRCDEVLPRYIGRRSHKRLG